MTIDVELLLARHPFLFLWRESSVEGFHSGGVLAAISGGRRDIHPLSAVQRAGLKLTNEKCCGEVAVHHKADILLFAADKAMPFASITERACSQRLAAWVAN